MRFKSSGVGRPQALWGSGRQSVSRGGAGGRWHHTAGPIAVPAAAGPGPKSHYKKPWCYSLLGLRMRRWSTPWPLVTALAFGNRLG